MDWSMDNSYENWLENQISKVIASCELYPETAASIHGRIPF